MNKTTLSPSPSRHAHKPSPSAATEAAEEDQYEAGPLTEMVSNALRTQPLAATGSHDAPVLFRRIRDGVAFMGVGPSAGLLRIDEQRDKDWIARTWGLVQARNLYIAYPFKHPGNEKVAAACQALKALCNRSDVQRSGLPCDRDLLRLLMVLKAADEELAIGLQAQPPEFTRPQSVIFQNPLPIIDEMPVSPVRVPPLAVAHLTRTPASLTDRHASKRDSGAEQRSTPRVDALSRRSKTQDRSGQRLQRGSDGGADRNAPAPQ
ncbi:hypothetical protein [Hydrogenophaga sp. T2]|uniref:hypothetical protein n=1 Tax=Hydrogenophaga sp. T2 TaxID=3132823 RepID=UPI003CEDFCB6